MNSFHRYTYSKPLHSICWHMEGRQFVGSYGDGALVTWNGTPAAGAKGANKPHSVVFPHGKKNKETNKVEPCDPIEKVTWLSIVDYHPCIFSCVVSPCYVPFIFPIRYVIFTYDVHKNIWGTPPSSHWHSNTT